MNRRARALLVAAGAFTVLAAATPAAHADPAVAGEFAVTSVGTNNELTLGPDGNMWVTLDAGNDVARITPDGTVTEFNPANLNNPVGIAAGPDGNLWVTQTNEVARFSPADPNAAVKFAVGAITDARGIVTGPDGNLWTASVNNVIRIPPANPVGFTAFPVVVGARDIDSGSDGNLWVADSAGIRSSALRQLAYQRPTPQVPALARRPSPQVRTIRSRMRTPLRIHNRSGASQPAAQRRQPPRRATPSASSLGPTGRTGFPGSSQVTSPA